MWATVKLFGRRTAGGAFALGCFATAYYAFTFLLHTIQPGNPFQHKFAASGWDVPAHFFGAGLALLLVPVQLNTWMRGRWPWIHRLSGWLSVSAILIGGISGLSMALNAQTGLVAGIGFGMLAALWLGTMARGLYLALHRDWAGHRRWMSRCVALTAAAISLRLMLGVGMGVFRLPFEVVYPVAAWACWIFNLAVCEAIVRWPSWRASAARDTRSASSRAAV